MLSKLKKLNPDIKFYDINDDAFCRYGKVIKNYDFTGMLSTMDTIEVPAEGNVYVQKVDALEKDSITPILSELFYGHMPIEVGYCNGNGSMMDAFEYHKGSEIDIAATDLVLLLGDLRDIKNNIYDSANVEAFYVTKGTAVELYSTTLHYAPCKVSDEGFKCIVVLPDQTNGTHPCRPEAIDESDKLLWKVNKWVICHPEGAAAPKGYYQGIIGKNLEVKIK